MSSMIKKVLDYKILLDNLPKSILDLPENKRWQPVKDWIGSFFPGTSDVGRVDFCRLIDVEPPSNKTLALCDFPSYDLADHAYSCIQKKRWRGVTLKAWLIRLKPSGTVDPLKMARDPVTGAEIDLPLFRGIIHLQNGIGLSNGGLTFQNGLHVATPTTSDFSVCPYKNSPLPPPGSISSISSSTSYSHASSRTSSMSTTSPPLKPYQEGFHHPIPPHPGNPVRPPHPTHPRHRLNPPSETMPKASSSRRPRNPHSTTRRSDTKPPPPLPSNTNSPPLPPSTTTTHIILTTSSPPLFVPSLLIHLTALLPAKSGPLTLTPGTHPHAALMIATFRSRGEAQTAVGVLDGSVLEGGGRIGAVVDGKGLEGWDWVKGPVIVVGE